MRIIIPMTGYGSRFVSAGYKNLKPLIRVQGRPIVEWIVKGMYSDEDEFIFVCRQEHLDKISEMRPLLLSLAPNVKIFAIDDWYKMGPVSDIMRVADRIPDDEPCIVTYCDVFLRWNYKELLENINKRKPDGAIICWTNFNPTTVPEINVFASCRVDESQNLVEIREKYDFESDRTKGHFSAGVYYFKSGKIMKKAFKDEMDAEDMVNGEFYVSLAYNYLLKDGLCVWVPDNCETFCNWGTPADMEDYLFWINQVSQINKRTNILIPMAGSGQRFVNAGYKTHKPLLPIIDRKNGKEMPMVCSAISDLPGVNDENSQIILVDRDFHKSEGVEEIIKSFFPTAKFVTANKLTDGQACTCLLAKEFINNDDELLISACDNGLAYNYDQYEALKHVCDVIVFTYKSITARSNPNAYGWMRVDQDNNIIGVSCKRAISDTPEKDNAVVATFWFRSGKIFVETAERMIKANDRVNNEFYVDQVIQHVIDCGYKAKVFPVDKYICWGTPKDYEAYLSTVKYWMDFYNSSSFLGDKR